MTTLVLTHVIDEVQTLYNMLPNAHTLELICIHLTTSILMQTPCHPKVKNDHSWNNPRQKLIQHILNVLIHIIAELQTLNNMHQNAPTVNTNLIK